MYCTVLYCTVIYNCYIVQSSRSNQRMMFAPPKLTVSGVFSKLKEIAAMTGSAVSLSKLLEFPGSLII